MTTSAYPRQIIHIDADACDGCGLCVSSCAEGAIQIVDGKAKLVSEQYCDGLGACLAPCPRGALSLVTRKADAFNPEAVEKHRAAMQSKAGHSAHPASKPVAAPSAGSEKLPCGCPGTMSRSLRGGKSDPEPSDAGRAPAAASELGNWPVKLRLIPPNAPYLAGAELVLAADCAPVALPDLHRRFLANSPIAIACPKFDDHGAHIAKLAEIIGRAGLSGIVTLRMEVPCCGGLARIAEEAVRQAGKETPLRVITIGIDGTMSE